MIDTVGDPVWFFWPVTFALVCAVTVHRLVQTREWGAAAFAVASVALPAVPLTLAIPVRCSDGDAVLDLGIPVLGLGLLGAVAWLAVLARLGERAGDTRTASDRRALISAIVLVPLMLVEYVASSITLAVRCNGTSEPMAWHLSVAAVVLVAGAATGAARQADAS